MLLSFFISEFSIYIKEKPAITTVLLQLESRGCVRLVINVKIWQYWHTLHEEYISCVVFGRTRNKEKLSVDEEAITLWEGGRFDWLR